MSLELQHLIIILFIFALGACVGSFLNVVVWRLPRDESLISPPSRCPQCGTRLAWYDNIPIFGWILLRGECRYCHKPISARYPVVEFVTAALFAIYYIAFFVLELGPCPRPMFIREDWPIYLLYMALLACLLAASLIDAELFIIPIEIPWLAAGLGVVVHTIIDRPGVPGVLNANSVGCALAAGSGAGLLLSIILLHRRIIPLSFAEGGPLLEHEREKLKEQPQSSTPREYTQAQVRAEIRKEMLFLLPPMILAIVWVMLCTSVSPIARRWNSATSYWWVSGLLGSLLGALVGGFVVWITRIFGSLAFGREAMGMGDVHLMFGVGAVVGAGAATVAFFIAPFFGILTAIYMLLSGKRRELPYGPYLSMATAFVMIWYCDIAEYLRPGMTGMSAMLRSLFGW